MAMHAPSWYTHDGGMQYQSVTKASVRGKRVLVRAGLDVAVSRAGRVMDAYRLEKAVPTVRWLLNRGARVIILGHRGRPQGKPVPSLSLRPVARELERRLRQRVRFVSLDFPLLRRSVAQLKDGELLLVDNLRCHPGEEKASRAFARQLAVLGDLYVNDDFATSHRRHASTSILPELLPSSAGLNVLEEVHALQQLKKTVARPFVAIIGGKKMHDKLGMLQELLPQLDAVLLGGGAANTLIKFEGQEIGKSLIDLRLRSSDRRILTQSAKVFTPFDSRIGTSPHSSRAENVPIQTIPKNKMILDIGSATAQSYTRILHTAKTVLWAGPVGYIENPAFRKGSASILRSIPRKVFAVAGGGDTIRMIDMLHGRSRFSFLSTGGGAMLAYLAGERLPALEALRR